MKNKTFFFVEIPGLARPHQRCSPPAPSSPRRRARASSATSRAAAISRRASAGASVDAAGNVLPGVNIGTYNVVQNDPQHIGFDPQHPAEIKNEPLPNNFTVGDGLNTAGYISAPRPPRRQHDQTIKIDQVINSKNTVYARFAWGSDDSICDTSTAGSPCSRAALPGEHRPPAAQLCVQLARTRPLPT